MKKRNLLLKIVLCGILGIAAFGPALQAWATFISPKRVMIEDKQRTATLTIHNNSNQTTAYRFEWEHRAQSPTGESLLLAEGQTTPGYQPVDSMLQYSPRQVILKPNTTQKLRILVRRPANLAPGEYHSHLLIKSEALSDDGNQEVSPQPGLAGTLKVRTNASIPVFLREGATMVDIKITNARVINKGAQTFIKYTIANNSTRSIYTVPFVDCIKDGTNSPVQITTARIYAEAKTLNLETPLPAETSLAGCTNLKLRLMGLDDLEYKSGMLITEAPINR